MINVIIIIVLFAFLGYGFVISRSITVSEYASFRDKADFKKITFSLLSSLVGGWMFFGLSAIGYEAGIVGYIMGFAYAIGLLILGHYSPKIKARLKENSNDTLDDFMGDNHGVSVQSVITGFNFLFFISILAAQFIALASFLELFAEFETRYIYYIAAIVVIIYTAVSGFKGVLLTDTYQFWIITFCVISITIIGYSQINLNSISELPNSYFNGLGYGASFIIGVFLFLPLSMLARSDLWQRIASSKDDQEVKKAFYVASPLIFIFYVLLTNLGIAAKAMGISVENPETSNLELFLNYGNTSGALDPTIFSVLVAIVSVGILSALVSTIDTNLNIISVAISKLFFKKSWNIERTDENPTETRNVLVRTGVISIILGILGIIFSMIVPDIVDLIVGAASIIMVFVPSIIGALFYKDKYPRLSVISIVGGLTSFIVLSIILQDPKISLLPGVLISFLIYFISRKFIKS